MLLAASIIGLGAMGATADEPAKGADTAQDGGPLVVIDNVGKEMKLKTWKLTNGTRRLAWLGAAAKEADPPKGKPTGPEALEFREENSTTFKEGILTLVPVDRLRELEFDNMKETVKLTAATGPKAEDTVTLTGLTKYVGINKITIEAEVDKGELGVAEVKLLGGVPKGVNVVKFPGTAKIAAAAEGRGATVTTKDKSGKATHKVTDFQPLYRAAGGETLNSLVFFKKTLKIDVAKITKFSITESGNESVWSVTLKDGSEESLTLLTTPMLDGKQATLIGFVARVPAGYKLFPPHVLEEVEFEAK
jgi:hypothetical protein